MIRTQEKQTHLNQPTVVCLGFNDIPNQAWLGFQKSGWGLQLTINHPPNQQVPSVVMCSKKYEESASFCCSTKLKQDRHIP